jgi:hypothetical protein
MWFTQQLSSTPLRRCLDVLMTKWHRLVRLAGNPYRPELHYMRGPGPKSHAKRHSSETSGAL